MTFKFQIEIKEHFLEYYIFSKKKKKFILTKFHNSKKRKRLKIQNQNIHLFSCKFCSNYIAWKQTSPSKWFFRLCIKLDHFNENIADCLSLKCKEQAITFFNTIREDSIVNSKLVNFSLSLKLHPEKISFENYLMLDKLIVSLYNFKKTVQKRFDHLHDITLENQNWPSFFVNRCWYAWRTFSQDVRVSNKN